MLVDMVQKSAVEDWWFHSMFKQLENRRRPWSWKISMPLWRSARTASTSTFDSHALSSSVIGNRGPGWHAAASSQRAPTSDRHGPHKTTSELLLGLPPAETLNICTDEHYCFPSSHLTLDQRSDDLLKHRTAMVKETIPKDVALRSLVYCLITKMHCVRNRSRSMRQNRLSHWSHPLCLCPPLG